MTKAQKVSRQSKRDKKNKKVPTLKLTKKQILGKIISIYFGHVQNTIGLHMTFQSGKENYVAIEYVELDKKYDSEKERADAYYKLLKYISDLLIITKKQAVQQLLNAPVELTIINGKFSSFRILTEVI